MIRDYWIYQDRPCETPWALYLVAEFERGKRDVTAIDYTIYSENIENSAHSISFVGRKFELVDDYVTDIAKELAPYCELNEDDIRQLQRELFYILR